MAQIKAEGVVDHLDTEFKKALEDTFSEFAPNVSIDRSQVFRFFLKRVYHHCSVWETVPDAIVKN
jgi:hypothetical protein